jgi:hypothetical protein
MKRFLIGSTVLIVGILIGSALGVVGTKFLGWRTTLTRLSPDETLRVSLVEREFPSIDRNFQVRLEDLVKGESTILLRSPDEGIPSGSERLIWSKDGKWLLLVGRHFFVKEDLFLDNGDQLFFLYHLPTKRGWINSADSIAWPPLKAPSIDGIDFTDSTILKPR